VDYPGEWLLDSGADGCGLFHVVGAGADRIVDRDEAAANRALGAGTTPTDRLDENPIAQSVGGQLADYCRPPVQMLFRTLTPGRSCCRVICRIAGADFRALARRRGAARVAFAGNGAAFEAYKTRVVKTLFPRSLLHGSIVGSCWGCACAINQALAPSSDLRGA